MVMLMTFGLVDTFFGGSMETAVSGLLDLGEERLSETEVAQLLERIEQERIQNAEEEKPDGGTHT